MLLEILVLIALAGFAANGFRAGIVEGIGRLVGALIGFWAAKTFAVVPVTIFSLFLPLAWSYVISFLVIFSITNHLVGFLFKAIDRIFGVLTNLPILKQISEIAGLVLGLLEGIVVIGGATFLLRQLENVGIVQTITGLKTIQAIEKIFTLLLGFFL